MAPRVKPGPDGMLVTDSTYVTGTEQVIGVHTPEGCTGRHCVIHNPSDHAMRDFPTHWRSDRMLMERICPHGVGHPDPDDLAYQEARFPQRAPGVHGCDGCCLPPDHPTRRRLQNG